MRIITTGGTFDKQYDPLKGELVFTESQLPKILKDARINYNIEIEGPIAIDSLYMSESERLMIKERIEKAEEDKILIIHGTDTMTKTADLLLDDPVIEKKTVVFTGAMVPYSLSSSDAEFNLGFAIASLKLLPPGVYIAMGAEIYDAGKVRKNREKGVFEAI